MRSKSWVLLVVAAMSAGCGPMPADTPVEVEERALVGTNGILYNGILYNGILYNGILYNSLGAAALANADFRAWFDEADGGNTAMHAQTMKYIVRCALRSDQTTSFRDRNGVTHTWTGALGLAPGWFTAPPSEVDREWVSGCLMAHVNTAEGAPKTIQISVRGEHPALSVTPIEQQALTTFDGAYFGDLFSASNKMYICGPSTAPASNYFQTLLTDWGRQCYFSSVRCEGFTRVDCATACQTGTGTGGAKYTRCTADGRTYRAVNVFLPKFSSARTFLKYGPVTLRTDCTNCLDGAALDGFHLSSVASASKSGMTTAAGDHVVQIRYANGSTRPRHIRFQVNGTDVMNGATNLWDFAPTGGNDTWKYRELRAYIPANAKLTLLSAGIAKQAPLIDTVALRLP